MGSELESFIQFGVVPNTLLGVYVTSWQYIASKRMTNVSVN